MILAIGKMKILNTCLIGKIIDNYGTIKIFAYHRVCFARRQPIHGRWLKITQLCPSMVCNGDWGVSGGQQYNPCDDYHRSH